MAALASMRWRWIAGRRADLVWFIGSAAAGWLYLALVWWLGRGLARPIQDPFFTLRLGDLALPLTLGLVVYGTWAILLDAPHLFATLARTFLDPDEWRTRGGVLGKSLLWFAVGPAVVLAGHALGTGAHALAASLFFVFFRLWAYYHVVRQHWGFLVLYKRKNDDVGDPVEDRADAWFFNLAMYLPLAMYLTAPWAPDAGLGLQAPLPGGLSAADVAHPLALALYPAALLVYAAFQVARWRRGFTRNGPKLLLLASIVPLHLVVFIEPLLSLFIVPAVTVGHNLQYHRIVWMYGRNRYLANSDPRFRRLRPLFRHVWLYAALGLAFTFLCYRGPLIERTKGLIAAAVDGLAGPAALLAGADASPGSRTSLGAEVAALLFLGWAMQHYYLDAKIWRVSRDREVARSLEVAAE